MNSENRKRILDSGRSDFLKKIKPLLPESIIGVEIGVNRGNFTKLIINELNIEKLYLVDPWEEGSDKNGKTKFYKRGGKQIPTAYSTNKDLNEVKHKFTKELNDKKIAIKKGFSYDLVGSFSNNYFDFIYIDACHLYDCVKSDLEAYLPKLKYGGLMCGHDYVNDPKFGVIKAVDEFMKENKDFYWKAKGKNGDWALGR